MKKIDFAETSDIYSAILYNQVSQVRDYILLDTNLVNYIRNVDGFTPLHSAVSHNNLTIVILLMKYGANPNQPCKTGITPIDLANRINDINPSILDLLTPYAPTNNDDLYFQSLGNHSLEEFIQINI